MMLNSGAKTRPSASNGIHYLDKSERNDLSRAHRLLEFRIDSPHVHQHSIIMLEFLARWRVRVHGLIAAFLLPLMQHNRITTRELSRFSPRTIQTVSEAYKHIYCDDMHHDTRIEHLRELFKSAFTDIEMVLICVADHMAYASGLSAQRDTAQQDWAHKNMDIYTPLLTMLGMWRYQRDLGNLGLAIKDAPYYERLERYILNYYHHTDDLFSDVKQALLPVFHKANIDVQVRPRYITPIHLHWKALQVKRRGDTANLDYAGILYVDVLCTTETECYVLLGIIHGQWKPAHRSTAPTFERFRDHIATPKYNGYRALVTTVIYPLIDKGDTAHILVKFRILTHEMQHINTEGIIAAMEGVLPIKNAWWSDLTLTEMINPPHDSTDMIPLRRPFAIFTPVGEAIYPLQPGTTILDLAFRIRPALGPYARRFRINGRQVPERQPLRHCDLIEIEYDTLYPSLNPEWSDYVHTPLARNHIRRFLKARNHSPHEGRNRIDAVLAREVKIYRMRFSDEKIEQLIQKVLRKFDCANPESLYMRVSEDSLSPDEIVASMIESEFVGHIARQDGEPWPAEHIHLARCWMQERQSKKWDRSSRIAPGVHIVGRLTGNPKSPVLVVHRQGCRNAPSADNAIPLRWAATTTLREAAEITITALPRADIVSKILDLVYTLTDENAHPVLSLSRFYADVNGDAAVIDLVVDAPSLDDITRLQTLLKDLQGNNLITEVDVWQLLPGQRMLIAGRPVRRQRNPYTLRQIKDREMFFGRETESSEVIEQIQQGQMFIVIYGQKRIGKTSLLHQLAEHLLPHSCDVLPIQFDAHSLVPFTSTTFLMGLVEATHRKLHQHLKHSDMHRKLRIQEKDFKNDPFGVFAAWAERIQEQLQGTKLFFMIDEFTRAEEEYRHERLDKSFFDGLQWLVGTQNIGFLLCVHDNIYHHNSYSWGLLQRGHPIRLDTLDSASAELLVRHPLQRLYQVEKAVVDEILSLTNCHPYFIHAICSKLVSQMSENHHDSIGMEDLSSTVTQVLRSGEHYFSHLLGPLSDDSKTTLKAIAYMGSGDNNTWISRDEIHDAMARQKIRRWKMAEAISELYRANILEARHAQSKVTYRIPVGLFQLWLRQCTHPFITQDMERED